MKLYQKEYLKGSGFKNVDWIPCEICEKTAVDIHHINARGMGGNPNKDKDVFENLMALCRTCHVEYGDIKEFKEMLNTIHKIRFKK